MEKLLLSDGYGNARSWCKDHGELLPKGVPVTVPLQLGECTGAVIPPVEKAPPPQGLPIKIGNIRPPLLTNDISKHSDVLEFSVPTQDPHQSRPLIAPAKPQTTVLNLFPAKPTPPPPHSNHVNPRPPLQPFHLQGPPGAWNIVTSKPGSLPPPIHVYQSKVASPASPASNGPNTEGIEVQFGPRLPLPPINPQPLHHFPPRRRPATKTGGQSALTLVTSTEHQLTATERVDQLAEADIIVIETNDIKTNITEDNEKPANQSIKTDILSDDQLTIFKVGPDNDIVRVRNDTKDNDTDTDTETDYKLVILHKLPNGNALNLENLKTYNYEDLIKGHSSVIEDSDQEKMDRENVKLFDVPRRISDDKTGAHRTSEPYIIYQIPDKTSHLKPSSGGPVYRPSVQPVYRPTTVLGSHLAQFDDTSSPNDTNINIHRASAPPNDWIPTNRKKNGLNLDKLTELSQLAQVSINNKGPIRVPSSPSYSSKLNVQLLPSRLSAVLSQLDTGHRERERSIESHSRERQGQVSHRQNKVSPAFQPVINKIRDRMYGRKIHSGQYVVTQPYQTQFIPSTNHKYIPLLHHKKPLWWQPHQQRYEFPVRPHQLLSSRHSYNRASPPVSAELSNNSSRTASGNISQENLTNTTILRALLNKTQSVLLGSNHSAPVYIIEYNNSRHRNLLDQDTLLRLNQTMERNFTEEITTEHPSDLEPLSTSDLNNEPPPSSHIQSLGNQKLNNTRLQSEDKRSNDLTLRDQSGKYLQELSPKHEDIKLNPYPASGMANKSQE